MNTRTRLGGWMAGVALLAAGLLGALAPRAEAVTATGGTVTNYTDAGGTNWTAHIFTSSVWNVTLNTNINFTSGGDVEVLVVAGGGGGGGGGSTWANGGGGGAGGLIYTSLLSLADGSYTVTVGNGGVGGADYTSAANNGGDSIFSGGVVSIVAFGGKGAAGWSGSPPSETGGSGAGGAGYTSVSGGSTGTSGTSGQGYGYYRKIRLAVLQPS